MAGLAGTQCKQEVLGLTPGAYISNSQAQRRMPAAPASEGTKKMSGARWQVNPVNMVSFGLSERLCLKNVSREQ